MRFARKPGESADTDGILPMRLQKAMDVSRVADEVCRPVMISTPFCTGTGFMKCVLITREAAERSFGSLDVLAAILVMEILLVLVARMAWEAQIWAREEKILVLRSTISYKAVSLWK